MKHNVLSRKQNNNNNDLGRNFIRLVIALALLPETLIEEGFKLIVTVIFEKDVKFQNFITYYENTWLKNFTPSSFCVFNQINRTNNATERHNRELKETLKIHSTVYEFLGKRSYWKML